MTAHCPLPICYITDENYFLPTIVSIESLIKTKSEESHYEVHLVTSFHPKEKHRKIISSVEKRSKKVSIELHASDAFKTRNVSAKKNHVSSTALLKYNLAEMLPQHDKIL